MRVITSIAVLLFATTLFAQQHAPQKAEQYKSFLPSEVSNLESSPVPQVILECDRAIYILNYGLTHRWATREQFINAFQAFDAKGTSGDLLDKTRLAIVSLLQNHLREHRILDEGTPVEVEVSRIISDLTQIRDAKLEEERAKDAAAAAAKQQPSAAMQNSGVITGTVRVSSGTMAAYNVKMVRPIYPSDAKSGQVVLRVTISKQGDVTKVTPVVGSPILITAAIDAVKQWKYKPYVLNGQPVEVDTTIRLGADFALPATDKPTPIESYVYEVALRFRITGSLVVSGTCTEEEGVSASSLPLPLAGSFNSLDNALKALVHADPNLRWSRESTGKYRVRDSRISDDILGVHIHNLRISNAAGIDEAIWQLMSAPDIKTAFAKNNIEHGIVPPGIMGNTKGMPRFSLQTQDTTLEAALDQVMTFYPGVWMYSECRSGQTRRITVRGEPTGWPSGGTKQ
jgi:TonB family protein